MIFAFIACEKAFHAVAMLCRVLGVSPVATMHGTHRGPSARAQANAALLARIEALHAQSRRTYGHHASTQTSVLQGSAVAASAWRG